MGPGNNLCSLTRELQFHSSTRPYYETWEKINNPSIVTRRLAGGTKRRKVNGRGWCGVSCRHHEFMPILNSLYKFEKESFRKRPAGQLDLLEISQLSFNWTVDCQNDIILKVLFIHIIEILKAVNVICVIYDLEGLSRNFYIFRNIKSLLILNIYVWFLNDFQELILWSLFDKPKIRHIINDTVWLSGII